MIEEAYVNFEIAKLLKEKGFNSGVCKNSPHYTYNKYGEFSGPSWDSEYPAPTLQMAMKWLRETYKLHIILRISRNTFLYGFKIVDNKGSVPYINNFIFDTYEKACESAIKCCLEHLI